MDTIKLSKENALKMYNVANEESKELMEQIFGKEMFDKSFLEQFKSFCEESGTNYGEFMNKYSILSENTLAHEMLNMIVPFYNKGYVADIKNKKQYRYFPAFYWDEQSGFAFSAADYRYARSSTDVGSRLCSESEAKCIEIAKKYLRIYEKWITA